MAARVIQCDYDDLAAIMASFCQQADQTRQLMDVMRRLIGDLQSGGWVGVGAQAFFSEMEDLVFPGMGRTAVQMAAGARAAPEGTSHAPIRNRPGQSISATRARSTASSGPTFAAQIRRNWPK